MFTLAAGLLVALLVALVFILRQDTRPHPAAVWIVVVGVVTILVASALFVVLVIFAIGESNGTT
jgi:xanthosine utilization system XapX-like protein